MNLKQFDKIVTDQLSRSELVLMGKGTEYAEEATDETEVDRLARPARSSCPAKPPPS